MALISTAFKGALLLGLVFTGIVDKEAIASPNQFPDRQPAFDQEFHATDASPAAIELLIEAPDFSYHLPVYFMEGSIELTPEAELVLLEVAGDIAASDDPAVHFFTFDSDEILAEQRMSVISAALADAGFTMARTFATPQIDLLMARDL